MRPIVAIVGRPNVGKSTLMNRLCGRKVAIVHDEPGVTRDRHYVDMNLDGRPIVLIDTGGFDPTSDDPMRVGIKRQIDVAIEEADVIICVLSAIEPPSATEHAELQLLRRASKPVIYVANKADNARSELEAYELHRLGIDKLVIVSALHGKNIDELEEAVLEKLPKLIETDEPEPIDLELGTRVAVVGKPNAGKSSLVNRLLGEDRLLVDDRPGTTRDAIDSVIERNEKRYVFVDTAGIRRKAKVTKEASVVESLSVVQAIRAMERCEVVALVVDADEGVAEQDAKILGLAADRGRGIVVALNKIDKLDKKAIAKAEADARDKLSFANFAVFTHISAKTGRGIDNFLGCIDKVGAAFRKRVGTGELNRFFAEVLATHPPPTHGGKAPRLYFITQAEAKPPLFVVSASEPEKIHFSYQRYVQNQIRKVFAFEGVPLKVMYRAKRRENRVRTAPPEKGARKPAAKPKRAPGAPRREE